jgi:D-tyrosyl-tRNA(Tyr) deacylase
MSFTAERIAAVRAVVQRIREASVNTDGEMIASSGPGLLVLLGVADRDDRETADRLARKVARLRVFEDDDGRLDRSLVEARGEALVVSQFTLIADTAKGNRPSFGHAAPPELAKSLYERFCETLRAERVPVQTGAFGERMQVALVNDGPVTIVLDVGP